MAAKQCVGICTYPIFVEKYKVKQKGKYTGIPTYLNYKKCTKCGYLIPKDDSITITRCACCGNRFKNSPYRNYAARKEKLRQALGVVYH